MRLAILLCLLLSTSAIAEPRFRIIAKTGDPAPGTDPGTYFSYPYIPVLNDAGDVAFESSLAGPVIGEDYAMGGWRLSPAGLQRIYRSGDPAPGAAPGVVFAADELVAPNLSDSGSIAFGSGLTGPGVTPANDQGAYLASGGTHSLLVREGDPAPGTEPGVVFRNFSYPFIGDADEIWLEAYLDGAGAPFGRDQGLWRRATAGGALSLVVREGDPAPGLPGATLFSLGDDVSLDGSVRPAFVGYTAASSQSPVPFALGDAGVAPVIPLGSPAPSTPPGVVFKYGGIPARGDDDERAFVAWLEGPGIPEFSAGIWVDRGAGVQLLVRDGQPAPGAAPDEVFFSEEFVGYGTLVANASGRVAFTGIVRGPDDPETGEWNLRGGLWSDGAGALQLVAMAGDPAPGLPGSQLGYPFSRVQINDRGQVAFQTTLTGALAGSRAIYVQRRNGALELIARSGGTIEFAPGDVRTIVYMDFTGLPRLRWRSWNDREELAFRVGWSEETSASVVATFDEDDDSVPDAVDNCPSVANLDQLDGDADAVGNLCDSCRLASNPRVPEAFLATNPWATLTGGQRDDDHDGYGNRCDAKFTPGAIVGAPDLAQLRASAGKSRATDVCGTTGARPCAIFDLDEGTALLVGAADLNRFRQLNGKLPGPKCTACPLECEAGPSGSCGPTP